MLSGAQIFSRVPRSSRIFRHFDSSYIVKVQVNNVLRLFLTFLNVTYKHLNTLAFQILIWSLRKHLNSLMATYHYYYE